MIEASQDLLVVPAKVRAGGDPELELNFLRNANAMLFRLVRERDLSLERRRVELEDALALAGRKQREVEILIESELNPLAGLFTRNELLARLRDCFALSARDPKHHFALLALDLDRFQVISDTLGPNAGNQILEEVAKRLVCCVRATDTVAFIGSHCTVANLGGGEFAILLGGIQRTVNAMRVAERIHKALAEPLALDRREVFVPASIGVAPGNLSYTAPEEILCDSRIAMHRAKMLGKSRTLLFTAEIRASTMVRWDLESDLHRALERSELRVYYQPKVNLDTGETVGFEALLRWQHPVRGLVSPIEFIPIAEETGLILPIGEWVLREACRQVADWNERLSALSQPLEVSVNLSNCQFADSSLFERVASALNDSRLPPRLLSLEITESCAAADAAHAILVIKQLKALGPGAMIDDFGTGYSSFHQLSQFPFDTLKIDRSFVQALDGDTRNGRSAQQEADGAEIVRTVMTLAENLGMKVIAEGVETSAQREKLLYLGCRYAQGYLFSKPLPAAAAEQLLVKQLGADQRLRVA